MLDAVFTASVDEIKVSGLTQWDRGQMLKITCPDLPADFQVHFTNRAREKAIPVQAAGADNTATVAIPDEILREPFEVLAHLYFTEGDAGLIGETVKTVRLPITPRAQPEDYVLDLPQEQLTDAEQIIDKMMDTYATQAAKAATKGALSSIQDALEDLPEGDTLVINDLTTGGAAAALSAEMGRVLGCRPNPNLLHNWYFAALVNQRGLTEYTGTSERYTVDRWYVTGKTTLFVNDGHVKFTNLASQANSFSQRLAVEIPAGTQLTISALTADGVFYSGTFDMPEYGGNAKTAFTTPDKVNARIYPANDDGKVDRLAFYTPYGASIELVAVKLELGGVQTLAHQDSDGNWILNEIPDYGEELAKCQRYYQLFSSADKRPTNLADYRPAMRTNPATGTITIDGVTYYYADANL